MTTTITGRVSGAAAADTTKRVPTSGASSAGVTSYGNFTWIGWVGWGNCWRGINPGSSAVAASPATDVTARVSAAPTANTTKRVTL